MLCKMESLNLKSLRSIAKRLGLRGYSRLRKDNLIDFIKDNLSSSSPPKPVPRPTLQTRPPRPNRDLLLHLHFQLGLDQIGQDSQNC